MQPASAVPLPATPVMGMGSGMALAIAGLMTPAMAAWNAACTAAWASLRVCVCVCAEGTATARHVVPAGGQAVSRAW